MGIEQFDQLGEVCQRPRQPVDLVDNDNVNFPGSDVIQELLQVGALGGPARIPAVIISGPLLSRAADVTQAHERAPGSFTGIPLKTLQTPMRDISSACCGAWSSHCWKSRGAARNLVTEAMELRRWKDDSNPYYLPRPLVRDKLPTCLRVALR